MKLDFPLLVDPSTQVASQYDVLGLPATMLVDKSGMFAFGGVGARDWNDAESREQILPLLEE